MKILLKQFVITALLLVSCLLNAQDGTNDPTFNPNDTGFGNAADGNIESIFIQQDGKIIIGGEFKHYKAINRNGIARLNENGTLDLTFDPGTGTNGIVSEIVELSNGKILIGGYFTEYNGVSKNRIARLNADGSLDETFDGGEGFNDGVLSIALQSDGNIIVGGSFTTYKNITVNRLVRLNSDGVIDTTFDSVGANNVISKVFVQPDNKILIGGLFTVLNDIPSVRVGRLNSDGTIDDSFTTGTGADNIVTSFGMDSNGKIYIGGWFTYYNGIIEKGLVRLNNDGTKDISFYYPFEQQTFVFDLLLQENEKIVVAGSLTNDTGLSNIAVLNNNGSIDNTFLGIGADFVSTSIGFSLDGKIILGGRFTSYNNIETDYVSFINPDGSMDAFISSGSATGANSYINATASAGTKVIIAGNFTNYNGVLRNKIAVINQDGILDSSFNPGEGPNGVVTKLLTQDDGKIIVTGYFSTYNGQPANHIARINIDGTLDAAFNLTGVYPIDVASINAATIDNNGRILVSANFVDENGVFVAYLLRLNSDGSIDNSFISTNVVEFVQNIVVQSDGKILLGRNASFALGNGNPVLYRLNPDGTIDTTFQQFYDDTLYFINAIVLQPDGKIVFTAIAPGNNSSPFSYILNRLNYDGTNDSSFNPGTANSNIELLKLQSDGKILLAGYFSLYNDLPQNKLTRLNADGSVDNTFNTGTGPNNNISAILLQPNDKIIIAGSFFSYNNIGRNRIARLYSSGALNVETPVINEEKIIIYKNADGVTVTSLQQNVTAVQVYDLAGRLLGGETTGGATEILVPCTNTKQNILIVKATLEDGTVITKKIY